MMNKYLANDLLQLDTLLELIKNQSADYLKALAERPTSTKATVKPTSKLPNEGFGAIEALRNFNENFEPIIVGASGPRYWGLVTGGTTPAAIMGDWLATVYDQNTQLIKGHGDISAVIELATIELLLDLFNLPHDYVGGFVSGATMSNFTCLAVARQWVGKQLGKDFAKEGISEEVAVLASTPHSSVVKSLALLGIGSNRIIPVKTMEGNREAVDIADLQRKIMELNGKPFILSTSGGTVNTVDFDDFVAIAKLKEQFNFWWHVDAAFGGFASCLDTHKNLLAGWEQADSITIDCHKWLNVPYENAAFFVKEKYKILQVETFQNSNAPYLGDPLEHFNYLNLLPENSRRLKALPVWFTLMAYGKQGYKEIVARCVDLAQQFGQMIATNKRFELLAPVRLNTVCFTLAGEENQDKVTDFLAGLNDTGEVFMTPTIYKGKNGIRAAFVNWRTQQEDIERVYALMTTITLEL